MFPNTSWVILGRMDMDKLVNIPGSLNSSFVGSAGTGRIQLTGWPELWNVDSTMSVSTPLR